jgi:hypothetical protein
MILLPKMNLSTLKLKRIQKRKAYNPWWFEFGASLWYNSTDMWKFPHTLWKWLLQRPYLRSIKYVLIAIIYYLPSFIVSKICFYHPLLTETSWFKEVIQLAQEAEESPYEVNLSRMRWIQSCFIQVEVWSAWKILAPIPMDPNFSSCTSLHHI